MRLDLYNPPPEVVICTINGEDLVLHTVMVCLETSEGKSTGRFATWATHGGLSTRIIGYDVERDLASCVVIARGTDFIYKEVLELIERVVGLEC